ncbi:MAG: hypothetical protein KGH54_04300, partial [Candidatus Micrarchaeota archaeon]|nr:hypothetical protein [Candidatus Micrarchaeota archaeon]
QTINQTLSYINQVNQSAYLIFYPDLSKAYSYLAQAQQVYSSSPSSAVSYANQAYSIAQGQYSQINSYRSLSTILLIVMAALVLYWLHVLMKPVKNAESNKKR